jgi:hypothetical protein
MVIQINIENVWFFCTTMFFNILWEHLYKFETNLMNIEYPKAFFKAYVTNDSIV